MRVHEVLFRQPMSPCEFSLGRSRWQIVMLCERRTSIRREGNRPRHIRYGRD